MLIMICDDDKRELETLKNNLKNYEGGHDLDLHIKAFSNPVEMMASIEAGEIPDVVILDIIMPGILGIEIAKDIKSRCGETTDIIFLTTSTDFAVEAFSLHASDYLVKPYDKTRLEAALDRVLAGKSRPKYITVKLEGEAARINIGDICFVEAGNHFVTIHLKTGEVVETRRSLSDYREEIGGEKGFMAVGASYIVNMRFARNLNGDGLFMVTGDFIPVPRRVKTQVKKAYFDYYAGEVSDI